MHVMGILLRQRQPATLKSTPPSQTSDRPGILKYFRVNILIFIEGKVTIITILMRLSLRIDDVNVYDSLREKLRKFNHTIPKCSIFSAMN